ncbi:MAG: pectinesterase family protein [Paludibacteraceae bacterium]
MKNICTKILAVTAMSVMSVAIMASTAIPMTVETYLTTSDATTTGTINNNDGGNLGSIQNGATATFTLTNESEQEMVLCFLTGSNSTNNPTVTVTLNDGSSDVFTSGAVAIENTGNWTPAIKHVFELGTVPAGTFSLQFSFASTGSYVCNLGSIGVYEKSAFIKSLDEMPGDITLSKGTYTKAQLQSAGNVGYMSNGASVYYPSLYVPYSGTATLNIGMVHYGDGTLTVQVADLCSGKTELTKEIAITSGVCQGLDNATSFELGNITAGYRSIKMTVSTTANYLCNYKALSLSLDGARAAITDATIEEQTTAAGTATDWQCYLPYNFAAGSVTIGLSVENGTVTATAQNDEGTAVTVDQDGNNFTILTPDHSKYTDVTFTLTPDDGFTAPKSTYTYRVCRIGEISLIGVTVDGAAVDVLTDINNSETGYSATVTSCYTSVPTVAAVQIDETDAAVGDPVVNGNTYTYTIHGSIGSGAITRDYTLILNNVHIYAPTGEEEAVDLKQNGGTRTDGVWTNGVYTLSTTSLDGYSEYFKMNGNDYTISLPADVQVTQLIFKECSNNYSGNDARLQSVTSTGATVYLPVENKFYHSTEGSKYDLIVNIEGHTAGTDICFNLPKKGQPMCWIQLTTLKVAPKTAPVKTAESVTIDDNHAVVAVTFDREIVNEVSASIADKTVTAQGGSSTLYFPIWDLEYASNNMLTIAAGAVKDAYDNTTDAAIEVAVNIPAKEAVVPAEYDYVVSTTEEFLAAIEAIRPTNENDVNAARKIIFLKNGEYDLGSTGETTVLWVRAHNLSLIGESRDGVIIHGYSYGISNPVLNLRNWQGYYLQDLTVRNDFDYGTGEFEGVAVAVYGGDKTIMKNVRLLSNQDTQVTGDRAYMEDCAIHGTVDFICGGGDNFYYHTDLVLENRSGNVIAAPSTSAASKWGYVFDHCTIKAADDATAVTAGSYSLGRPWQNEPRIAFLHTTMEVVCSAAGWAGMSEILPTHFYEYGSVDSEGNKVDESGRQNSSTSENKYDPILTADSAAHFTARNVLGGTDAWDAASKAAQVSAPAVALNQTTLSWEAVDDALLYVVFKDGEYVANITTTSYSLGASGNYTVKAANRFGGLGAASNTVTYKATATGCESATGDTVPTVRKVFRDGQLIIVRDGKEYNALGGLVK